VALNGVSLTVAGLAGEAFFVTLIPHTLAVTNLGGLRVGDGVNLEVDLIARYLERLVGRA
jgi:riboflavin synthase